MNLYFVRHGATDARQQAKTQTPDEPLNDKGLEQAKKIAHRFEDFKFDLVVSSSYTRALQTANFISKKVIASDLFIETRKPSEIVGLAYENPQVASVLKKIKEKFVSDPHWHYSDEENFYDLKKRGHQAIKFLESFNQDNILVVSHGNFISFLTSLLFFGDKLTPQIVVDAKKFLRLGNTGISILTNEYGPWQLKCWNDQAHLLD